MFERENDSETELNILLGFLIKKATKSFSRESYTQIFTSVE